MSRGSTILAEKRICCWCGAAAADKLCACRRVSFCNKECLLKAWPEHRLSCPKAGSGKKANKFYNGDIVEIQGLQSEEGKKLNGFLGEVVGEEKDRLQILISPEDFVIKSFSLKPENVKIHLRVPEAAAKSVKLEREMQNTYFPQPDVDQLNARRRQLPRISGKCILSRLKEGDIATMLAFKGYGISPDQSTDMLQNGFIDLCYEWLKFPTAYNTKDQDSFGGYVQIYLLQILSQSLNVKTKQQNHFKSEALQKIAPVVVLTASKKRRIFGRTDDWLVVFMGVLRIFAAFCVTGESDDFLGGTMPTIVQSFDPYIRKALIEIMIAAVSIDPTWFVRKRSIAAEIGSQVTERDKDLHARVALEVLISIVNSKEKNPPLRQVGLTKVPMGSKFAGRSFASSFLKITATVGLRTLAVKGDLSSSQLAHFIYLKFLSSNDEKLQREIGSPDIEFFESVQSASVDAFRTWAEEKLASDG